MSEQVPPEPEAGGAVEAKAEAGASPTVAALTDMARTLLLTHRDGEGRLAYVMQIDEMPSKNAVYAVIDYNDLVTEGGEIARAFNESADVALEAFATAITDILAIKFRDYAGRRKRDIRARIVNYPMHRSLRKINSEVIGKMTSVSGMVVRASEVKPHAQEVTYTCPEGHPNRVVLLKGMSVAPPPKCAFPKCDHRDLEVDEAQSRFVDFQSMRLQDLPEDIPPGGMPEYIDVNVKQDLVDNARPGDRIVLTGIVRIEQERVTGVPQGKSGLYRFIMDSNSVEFLGGRGSKISRTTEREAVSPEEEREIQLLARAPDTYDRLIQSFAPNIMGHEIIKEAILLLIVGALERRLPDGGKIRGDINVFLVGDPGTAKSAMLKFCSRIAPRGLYTSGRGSTAAGLTAAVIRDTRTGMMMLEAGAVVLGDQGLVCIDEFDKMKPEDSSALHEVMEQQSVSVAKGGIVATLNARSSILAAANPMYGKYDPYKNLNENVNLPIPLLTRFDLIFAVRDKPSKERDREMASHIINLHTPGGVSAKSLIDPDMLTKYLAYAKHGDPQLTEEAKDKIIEYYLKMRHVESEDMITVTPRQLEGLVRLAMARARLLMRTRVEVEDAERAIYLVQAMLQDVGVDVNTGKVDMGVLQGKPRSEMGKLQLFMDILKSLEGTPKEPVEEKRLVEELLKSTKFDEEEARKYVAKLQRDGVIYESRSGHYNRT